MRSATRFLLSGLVTVMVLSVGAAAGVLWQTGHVEQSRTLQQLQVAATVERALQANRFQELQLRAEVLANDPAFIDYVAQSLIPDLRLGGAIDKASISDLLKERRHGYAVAMVLDPRGEPVAASGVLLRDPASVRSDPLVVKAIQTHAPVQGIWIDHGQLLWVAINPLLRGGVVQGVLVTAAYVDDAFATAVSRIARTAVAFVIQQPAAGSLPGPSSHVEDWLAGALAARRPSLLGQHAERRVEISDARHRVAAWVVPLDTADGRAAMVTIAPSASAGHLVNVEAMPLLLGIGAFGVIGVLLVLWQWRRTQQPLQDLLEVIRRSVQTGDAHLTVRVEGSPIVCHLRDEVNRLLQCYQAPFKDP